MTFRLRNLRRRLGFSAPRMVVRSALPWPIRWALIAIVLGFCASIALWAFEFGRDIAGLDRDAKSEVQALRAALERMEVQLQGAISQKESAESVANTADALVATERASRIKLEEQIKQLELDNQSLRADLGFFEKLIPSNEAVSLAIRGVQVDKLSETEYKWQVMIIQPVRGAADFVGKLEMQFTGNADGKAWSAALPLGAQSVRISKYGRVEGRIEIPSHVVLKSVTVRVLDGATVRASQTQKL